MRRAGPGMRCFRAATGSTACRRPPRTRWEPTGTPRAAVSCRRYPCPGAWPPEARSDFSSPFAWASALERRSRVGDVAVKEGRSGTLVFVHVRHEVRQDSSLALIEDQRIVYSGPGAAGTPPRRRPRSGKTPSWTRTIRPDAALLFRYSALTYNGHRIHYDRRYATEEEGYAGLVVHGPLIATYLLDLCFRNRPGSSVAEFAYRPIRPLFEGQPIVLAGGPGASGETVELWALGPDGEVAIRASARFGAAATGLE